LGGGLPEDLGQTVCGQHALAPDQKRIAIGSGQSPLHRFVEWPEFQGQQALQDQRFAFLAAFLAALFQTLSGWENSSL
jgi:hypothetical protein